MALLDQEDDGGFMLLETQRPLQPTRRRLGWLEVLMSVLHRDIDFKVSIIP